VSYIKKKLVYKDDDINIDFDKETRAVNILKEKTNERRKMKSEKFKIVTPNDVDCFSRPMEG